MTAPHPYQATKDKARKSGYSSLSLAEEWEWHADVYAFRHVRLGRPLTEASPVDPERKWFDGAKVQKVLGWYGKREEAPAPTRQEYITHCIHHGFRNRLADMGLDDNGWPIDRGAQDWQERAEAGFRRAGVRERQREPSEEERGRVRAVLDEWARARRFANWAAAEAAGHDMGEVCASILKAGQPQPVMALVGEAPEVLAASIAAAFGVSVREVEEAAE